MFVMSGLTLCPHAQSRAASLLRRTSAVHLYGLLLPNDDTTRRIVKILHKAQVIDHLISKGYSRTFDLISLLKRGVLVDESNRKKSPTEQQRAQSHALVRALIQRDGVDPPGFASCAIDALSLHEDFPHLAPNERMLLRGSAIFVQNSQNEELVRWRVKGTGRGLKDACFNWFRCVC